MLMHVLEPRRDVPLHVKPLHPDSPIVRIEKLELALEKVREVNGSPDIIQALLTALENARAELRSF